jgi:hypothetical protein
MTKEEMERTVLEESWRWNRPVGPSLEVTDDDKYRVTTLIQYQILKMRNHKVVFFSMLLQKREHTFVPQHFCSMKNEEYTHHDKQILKNYIPINFTIKSSAICCM